MPAQSVSRILAFDYLRGFFILVILVDHVWLWPNFFSFISGEGKLWITAAEGFVIISGLLVGYIRGYKNRQLPWSDVAGKLLRRSATLYFWSILTACLFTGAYWLLFKNSHFGAMPYVPLETFNWGQLVAQSAGLQYAHVWTHFLHLYAIFLVIAVPMILLLRRTLWWLVALISMSLYLIGNWLYVEWLVWQALFFLPAIIGYYLEPIRRWFGQQPTTAQRTIKIIIASLTLITLGTSVLLTFQGGAVATLFSSHASFEAVTNGIAHLFNRDTPSMVWLVMALLWFSGFYLLFQATLPFLQRWLGWLLEPFGTRSLTAYILHGVPVFCAAYFYTNNTNIWVNSGVTLVAVLATWALLQPRWLQKIIPR